MKFFLAVLLCIGFFQSFCQPPIPYDEIIKKVKRGVVPILADDPETKDKLTHVGTGFSVFFGGTKECHAFVTCEHVVSIKDSITKKTVKTYKNLYAQLNLKGDSTVTVKLEVMYTDEINDYAILQIKQPLNPYLKDYPINIQSTNLFSLDDDKDLNEGDYLLYIGYPMSFGVGKRSYPVSRIGIVSQNIQDSTKFLVDGFVQGGYSGSPIYRIRIDQKAGVWKFLIVGLLQAYPIEKVYLRPKSNLKDSKDDLELKVNPGFTIALKINQIKEKLKTFTCID